MMYSVQDTIHIAFGLFDNYKDIIITIICNLKITFDYYVTKVLN